MEASVLVDGFIKAMTSYGGDYYDDYCDFWNTQNEAMYKEWLDEQKKVKDVVLYRGYTFNEDYYNDACFEVGSVVGVDALTQEFMPSFTDSPLRAIRYINDYGDVGFDSSVRVFFVINTNGNSFVDISSLSRYPEENEYKCTDNVLLRVANIERMPTYWQITLNEE